MVPSLGADRRTDGAYPRKGHGRRVRPGDPMTGTSQRQAQAVVKAHLVSAFMSSARIVGCLSLPEFGPLCRFIGNSHPFEPLPDFDPSKVDPCSMRQLCPKGSKRRSFFINDNHAQDVRPRSLVLPSRTAPHH